MWFLIYLMLCGNAAHSCTVQLRLHILRIVIRSPTSSPRSNFFFLALFPGTDSDLPFSLDFGRILLDRLCQTNNIIHH